MRNPWEDLPPSQPFIAPSDEPLLKPVLDKANLKLDLLPQPWTGNPATARVIMLALNPGFSDEDYAELRNPDYAEQWRRALTFETRTPFYFLDGAFANTGGYRWWFRRLQALIDEVGLQSVARRVMCIEHFGYKSARYVPLGVTLPSQVFSFELVRDAISARKQVVVMRSERIWLQSVPELRDYPYVRLKNNQNPYLSRAQMTTDQFSSLVNALC